MKRRSAIHYSYYYRLVGADMTVYAVYKQGQMVAAFQHRILTVEAWEMALSALSFKNAREIALETLAPQPGKGETPEVHGTRIKAQFYNSAASAKQTGPGTGANAPTPDPARWVSGHGEGMGIAEMYYERWSSSTKPGEFKAARIVELDTFGQVVRVIRQSNIDGGGTPSMSTFPQEPVKPLHVPRDTVIEKIQAKIDEAKAKHQEQQDRLAAEQQTKVDLVSALVANPFYVVKLFEGCLRTLNSDNFADADAVLKYVKDYYGTIPGADEFVTPESLRKMLAIYEAATDDVIEVHSGDSVYSIL